MRLCVAIPCFFPGMELSEAIYRIAALGYDCAETYAWQDIDVQKARRAMQECNVELLSMCTSYFNMTDPAHRGKWLSSLRESCEAAKRLNVKRLITQVGPDTGAERGFQHESIVQALRAAAPILEDYGVTIMIEPLNTLVNHPGYYLTAAREGFEIIREAEHPLVKLVYDIYHQQVTEGNILPTILGNLEHIAHLHAAGHPGRNELQLGENDYRVIFDRVDRAGYTGACGLEYIPLTEPEASLRTTKEIYG